MPRPKKIDDPPEPAKRETPPAKAEDDPFMKKIQGVLETLMDGQTGKELNAVVTNAIRFLALKHKIVNQEEEGSVWDDD